MNKINYNSEALLLKELKLCYDYFAKEANWDLWTNSG